MSTFATFATLTRQLKEQLADDTDVLMSFLAVAIFDIYSNTGTTRMECFLWKKY